MWFIALKNIKEIWRDKKIFVTSLFFPILLLFVSRFVLGRTAFFTENIPLAVVNPEKNFPQAGELLVMALQRAVSRQNNHPLYAVIEINREQALQSLQKGKVSGVLLIPQGLSPKLFAGKKEKLSLILNDSDPRAGVLAGSLSEILDHFGRVVNSTREKQWENPISLATVNQGKAPLSPDYESLANVTLFAFLFLIPFAAGQWVSEIERGSLTRFRLAMTSPTRLVGGIFLSTAFLGFCQGVTLLVTAFLLGLRPYLLALWLVPLVAVFVLAAIGLGMILASFTEKEKQLQLVSSLLLIPLFVLSGSLGKELAAAAWAAHLPWSQGYALLQEVLGSASPTGPLAAQALTSALLFAGFGTAVFSLRRLRHE